MKVFSRTRHHNRKFYRTAGSPSKFSYIGYNKNKRYISSISIYRNSYKKTIRLLDIGCDCLSEYIGGNPHFPMDNKMSNY